VENLVKSLCLAVFVSVFTFIPLSFAGSDGAPMVEVPGGKFKSGPDLHEVEVKSFKIDKFEVTNAQYKKFKSDFMAPDGKDDHPAVEISYFDAEAYCKAQGKRLPTREEWEKAARGEDGRLYPWGNEFDPDAANTADGGPGDTTPVGSYEKGKSPYGAMDMSGNVWEWVDAWNTNDKRYRIQLGGSYFDDKNKSTTISNLLSIPDDMHTFVGFRCVK